MRKLSAKKRIPVHGMTPFYYLGGMALFLFLVLVASGLLLALYYRASPEAAFESVQRIMTDVEFGWLIRSVHAWAANLLIGVVFIHLLTAYVMRAYAAPRELTWVTGYGLMGIFLVFGFSGYLLPWNELSFFATRVGTAIAGATPVIGDDLLVLMRAGENVTGDTLSRFHALHVSILPLLAFAVLALHLYLVQRHGMSVPAAAADQHGGAKKVPTMPFVPHFLLRDMVGWYVALGLLAALAALFPWELGEKADPFGAAPAGIKPEWYFLFMFQALKKLPPHILGIEGEVLGLAFFNLAFLVVLAVPFLDRGPTPGRARRLLNVFFGVGVAFFVVMTIWGLVE